MGYKNIHAIIKCERSEPGKIEIELSRVNMLSFNACEASQKKVKIELSQAENFALFPQILAS